MESVPFSERRRKRAGQLVTVDVFGPYSGGGDFDKSVGKEKKALEFTVVSERFLRRWTKGLLEEINELYVLTSIRPNMNITYKMPYVSTNYIPTYMYIQ